MKAEVLNDSIHLETISRALGISTLYYPGCGYDWRTFAELPQIQVTYLDILKEIAQATTGQKISFILGDMRSSPFRDNLFDAVYLKDLHASAEAEFQEYKDAIRVVKPNGFVIFNGVCWEDISYNKFESEYLKKHPMLRHTGTAGLNEVFQKISNELSL